MTTHYMQGDMFIPWASRHLNVGLPLRQASENSVQPDMEKKTLIGRSFRTMLHRVSNLSEKSSIANNVPYHLGKLARDSFGQLYLPMPVVFPPPMKIHYLEAIDGVSGLLTG